MDGSPAVTYTMDPGAFFNNPQALAQVFGARAQMWA